MKQFLPKSFGKVVIPIVTVTYEAWHMMCSLYLSPLTSKVFAILASRLTPSRWLTRWASSHHWLTPPHCHALLFSLDLKMSSNF